MLSISLYLVRGKVSIYLPVWGWGLGGPRDLKTASVFSPHTYLGVGVRVPRPSGEVDSLPPFSIHGTCRSCSRRGSRLSASSPAQPAVSDSPTRGPGQRPELRYRGSRGLPGGVPGFLCHTWGLGTSMAFLMEKERERKAEQAQAQVGGHVLWPAPRPRAGHGTRGAM